MKIDVFFYCIACDEELLYMEDDKDGDPIYICPDCGYKLLVHGEWDNEA